MRVSLVKYPQYLKKKSKGQKSMEKHSKSIEPRPVVLCLWKHSCSFHRCSEPWVVESASLYWFQRFSNGMDIWNNELIKTGVKIQTPPSLSSPPPPPASSSEAQHHRPDPTLELNFCVIIAQGLALRKWGSYKKNHFIIAFLSWFATLMYWTLAPCFSFGFRGWTNDFNSLN